MSALLDIALAAASRGWHVFPIRPGDKLPAVREWETRATVDPDRIRRCWSAGAFNIGVACGPSGLTVVDLDRPKPGKTTPAEWQMPGVNDGGDVLTVLADRHATPTAYAQMWDTYTVTTGGGGTHLYYRHPEVGPELRNTQAALGWLIDTRAHGGYVVAAGSEVNGLPYRVEWDRDPAPLPDWLVTLLAPAPLPPQQPVTVELGSDRTAAYLRAAIDRQLALIAGAPEGKRNHVLYMSAVLLGQFVAGGALTDTDVTGLLTQAAYSSGLRPRETDRTIRSGLTAGARRPRSVAA
ncbi:bifunctional DNA primase/polymerase [Phytohabitans kaempferiae]|uniref:Bifunctional DNA primase/polymerase n=1 Tax=Phytohabitans kaempferiae TaxID=1620943 RepID=A0ABV6MGU7_9ACTN